ncbi:primary active transporter [Lithospermum erythrorhizon]|uniref:Primary active transporter n=1 Tax=Lithospermum erythrorhizon TaxID=34254 RepID=A0AAV3NZB4_LITER
MASLAGTRHLQQKGLNLIVKASSSLGGAAAGVSRNAWQLLSIFLATIVCIITQPLPLGVVALMGLGACVLTKTLTFAAAFSAFGDPIPWLIALAFFFARGFIKTGLGNRIAYQFVKLFGSSSLGLGFSLVFSEALLALAIPSVSARAGGIFLPLVKSLCVACGSNDPTTLKPEARGAFLCMQCSNVG